MALAVALVGVTCAFPTDKSDKVFATLEAPSAVVLRGQDMSVFARAWHVVGNDTQPIANAHFQFATGSATIARVEASGGGYATVTGVNSGFVDIVAKAVAFEQAQQADLLLRVSNPLEVDSVRPSLVRFGDTITVYGVGVDSIFFAFLDNNVTLFDYPIPGLLPTRTRDSLGFSTATFWVTPPARSSQLTFFGPGVFGNAPDTTRVIPVDRFEPNETAAWPVNLDAPPRFPAVPQIRFYNPALAFEIPRRDAVGIEWYRFEQTVPRDLTLILTSPEARGTFATFFTDSLSYDPADSSYGIGPQSWTLGPSSHFCGGIPFQPAELQPESTIVALAGMPAGALHAIAFYAQPARYGLAVIEGYVTSNPAVPRDAHEEDDFCDAADARGSAATIPATRFRDTLTIDNPHDVDWIAFEVTTAIGELVHFRLASLVPGDTLSDVDLYVVSDAAAGLVQQGSGVNVGSVEDFTLLLAPGRYYAVVVDFAGVPIPYSICFEAGTCGGAFPAGPSGSAATVPSLNRAEAPQPANRLRPFARP
ncbi:MAG: hypothetical protein WD773_00825 [Gemmatimonadales bacterium]